MAKLKQKTADMPNEKRRQKKQFRTGHGYDLMAIAKMDQIVIPGGKIEDISLFALLELSPNPLASSCR